MNGRKRRRRKEEEERKIEKEFSRPAKEYQILLRELVSKSSLITHTKTHITYTKRGYTQGNTERVVSSLVRFFSSKRVFDL